MNTNGEENNKGYRRETKVSGSLFCLVIRSVLSLLLL